MWVGNIVGWWKLARSSRFICRMQQTKSLKLYMFTFPITKSLWSYLELLLICLLELGFGFDESLPQDQPVGKSPYYRPFDRSANWHVKDSIISSMSNLQPKWCLKIDFQKVDQHLRMTSITTANNLCLVESQFAASQYKQNSSHGACESWKTRILCQKAMRYLKQIWGTKPGRVSHPLVSHEVTKLVKIGNHNIPNKFLNSINIKKQCSPTYHISSSHQTIKLTYCIVKKVETTSTVYGITNYFMYENKFQSKNIYRRKITGKTWVM